ncbi:MAG: hypothetical protein J3K34DRAFT_435463 [Monoraphidium minutum]|nr:MAG: hypothetical protein J3K34DRAFT_435463 [Monoraphidium minutum]
MASSMRLHTSLARAAQSSPSSPPPPRRSSAGAHRSTAAAPQVAVNVALRVGAFMTALLSAPAAFVAIHGSRLRSASASARHTCGGTGSVLDVSRSSAAVSTSPAVTSHSSRVLHSGNRSGCETAAAATEDAENAARRSARCAARAGVSGTRLVTASVSACSRLTMSMPLSSIILVGSTTKGRAMVAAVDAQTQLGLEQRRRQWPALRRALSCCKSSCPRAGALILLNGQLRCQRDGAAAHHWGGRDWARSRCQTRRADQLATI